MVNHRGFLFDLIELRDMDTTDVWRKVYGFPKYVMNAEGEIQQAYTGKVMAQMKSANSIIVKLTKDGRRRNCTVKALRMATYPEWSQE